MKTKIFFFILATALVNISYAQHFTAQFTGLGSVENTSPYHMVAVNDSIIWASSSSPKVELFANVPNLIVHSVDGGITWITDTLQVDLQYPGNFYISCISAIGSDSAWVSGVENLLSPNSENKIYATFDGGANWEIQNVPFSNKEIYCEQIHFFDHLEGLIFAGSTDGYFQVFKTYDGGKTWNRLPQENFPPIIANNAGSFDDGYYAIEDTIWVGTNKGSILKSIDRGTSWSIIGTPAPSVNIFDITFSDSKYGIARYYEDFNSLYDFYTKKLLVTTNGGESWDTVAPQGLESWMFDINGVPGKAGEYICTSFSANMLASNNLYYSNDNGSSWSILSQINLPGRIALYNSETGWISEIARSTPDIDVYKMEGLITNKEEVVIEGISIYPNPFKEGLIIDNYNGNKVELITITDFLGRRVYSKTINSSSPIHIDDLSFLSQGIYFLNIKLEKGLFSEKIIKQ